METLPELIRWTTSLFAIALMLFLLTLVLNLISQWVVNRFRERYE